MLKTEKMQEAIDRTHGLSKVIGDPLKATDRLSVAIDDRAEEAESHPAGTQAPARTQNVLATVPGIDAVVAVTSPVVRQLFEHPPLLRDENRQAYQALAATIAMEINPVDMLEWSLLRDIVEHEWAIRRLHRMKSELIEGSRKDALKTLIKSQINDGTKDNKELDPHAARLAHVWDRDERLRHVSQDSLNPMFTSDAIHAEAFAARRRELESLERMLGSLERRRSAAYREIEARRARLAKAKHIPER